MSALELKVYEIFKSKFSEQEAAIVIEYFEAKAEQKYVEKKMYLQQSKTFQKQKQISLNGCLYFG